MLKTNRLAISFAIPHFGGKLQALQSNVDQAGKNDICKGDVTLIKQRN
jgi:hypothetical protein